MRRHLTSLIARRRRPLPSRLVEGQYLEFKRSLPPAPQLAASIAALANGGATRRWAELWVGIADDGTPCGVEGATEPEVWRAMQHTIKVATRTLHPRPTIKLQRVWLDATRVVVRLRIGTLNRAHGINGAYYVRDNAANYLATMDEAKALRRHRYLRPQRVSRKVGVWLFRCLSCLLLLGVGSIAVARYAATVMWYQRGPNAGPNGTSQYLDRVAPLAGGRIIAYHGWGGGSEFQIFNPAMGQIERSLRPNNRDAPFDFDVSPAGTHLLFAQDGQLWQTVISDGTTTPISSSSLVSPIRLARYTPDGTGILVVIQQSDEQLAWLDVNGEELTPLMSLPGQVQAIQLSSDQRVLVVLVKVGDGRQLLLRTAFDRATRTLHNQQEIWQTIWPTHGVAVDRTGTWAYIGVQNHRVWGIDAVNLNTGASHPISAFLEDYPRFTADEGMLLAHAFRLPFDHQIVQLDLEPSWIVRVILRFVRLLQQWGGWTFLWLFRHLPVIVIGMLTMLIVGVGISRAYVADERAQ